MAEDMKNLLPVELKERIDYLSGQEIGHNGIYYVQDVGTKVAGKLYMCRTMKKIFRCKADNTLTYIDDSKYESMSLETLLDKLQNLITSKDIVLLKSGESVIPDKIIMCIPTIYTYYDNSDISFYDHWSPQVDGNKCRFVKTSSVHWSGTGCIIAIHEI